MKEKNYYDRFEENIVRKEERKIWARNRSITLYWLGVLGMVGWSVMVPVILGIILGLWIDRSIHTHYSFTLMLMIAGLAGGCALGWFWVKRMANNFECRESGDVKECLEEIKNKQKIKK